MPPSPLPAVDLPPAGVIRCACGQRLGDVAADGGVVVIVRMRPGQHRTIRDPREMTCEKCGRVWKPPPRAEAA